MSPLLYFFFCRLLELAKNETLVRRQNYFTLLRFMSSNPVGNAIVWDFYRTEYPYLVNRFTLNDRYFGRIIVDITADFSTKDKLAEVRITFTNYENLCANFFTKWFFSWSASSHNIRKAARAQERDKLH